MNYTHVPDIGCFFSTSAKGAFGNAVIPEAHYEYEIILVTEGNAEIIINGHSQSVSSHSLIVINRLEQHYFKMESGYKRYVLSISKDFLLSNLNDMKLYAIFMQRSAKFNHVMPLPADLYSDILYSFQKITSECVCQDSFYITKCSSIIIGFLVSLYRYFPESFSTESITPLSHIIFKIQAYIFEHYSEHITLTELAEKYYLSRHTLSIGFQKYVGISFKEYLISFRINEAKKLLISSDLSVEQIAENVGYLNINNFIKIFKKNESLTPLQYRIKYMGQLEN